MGAAPGQTQILLFLPEVQNFFKHKHFSDCCVTFVDFQGTKLVVFVNFVQLYSDFWGRFACLIIQP